MDGRGRLVRRLLDGPLARREYPGLDPLGRTFWVRGMEGDTLEAEVVGVVEDHQLSSLGGAVRPAMFFPHAQRASGTLRLAVATTGNPGGLSRPIQELIWAQDRDIVLGDAQTMEQALSNSVADVRAVTTVLGMFATVAMALAALGLYGVLAYFVSRRTHEIGIRVALGASAATVIRDVLGRGMLLVFVGLALGIGGAVGATRLAGDLLQQMLFQTQATDPATFASVAGVFVAVALGACLLPAWRALRVDPVEAFRAD